MVDKMESDDIKNVVIKNYTKNMTCLQTAFDVVCEKYAICSLLMFAWGWSFEYDSLEENIFNRLKFRFSMDTNLYMEMFMGMHVDYYMDKIENVYSHIVKNVKEKKELIIGVDAYYCPWNPVYYSEHIEHYFYVSDYDEERKIFFCIDPYISGNSKEVYELDMGLLKKGYKNYRVMSISKPLTELSYRSMYEQIISGYKNSEESIEEKYKKFSHDIKHCVDYEDLFNGVNFRQCFLIIKMNQYEGDRMGISALLVCLESMLKEDNELSNLYEEFYVLANMWKQIRFLFEKQMIRNKLNLVNLNKMAEKIIEIGNREREVFNQIACYLRREQECTGVIY